MNEPFYPERGAGELQRFLQDKRIELHSLDVELQKAHDLADEAEERWQEHYDSIMDQLEEDIEAGRISKMPGEDLRISQARRTGDGRSIWNTHRRAERIVKKLTQRSTDIRGQISAAQSEAKVGS